MNELIKSIVADEALLNTPELREAAERACRYAIRSVIAKHYEDVKTDIGIHG